MKIIITMKKIIIITSIVFTLFGLYNMYNSPKVIHYYIPTPIDDSMAWLENEDSRSDDLIPEEYRGEKEWVPMKVVECIKKDNGKFEITFINDYYIDSNTPAKIGDTDRCWLNTWYYPKVYPTSDSVVFENPYIK